MNQRLENNIKIINFGNFYARNFKGIDIEKSI